jgi:hypothetical protein
MSSEERVRETDFRRRLWARRISDLIAIVSHDPETYMPLGTFHETVMLPGLIYSTRRWLDRIEAELAKKGPVAPSGLRLVGGSRALAESRPLEPRKLSEAAPEVEPEAADEGGKCDAAPSG